MTNDVVEVEELNLESMKTACTVRLATVFGCLPPHQLCQLQQALRQLQNIPVSADTIVTILSTVLKEAEPDDD